jgi:hypothetical protein
MNGTMSHAPLFPREHMVSIADAIEAYEAVALAWRQGRWCKGLAPRIRHACGRQRLGKPSVQSKPWRL